jgi:hypothetical protein
MLHRTRYNGSRINTTFGWEDDDNIGTSHYVLLFGDQHETFGTSKMLNEVMESNRSLVHDRECLSQHCSRVSDCLACVIVEQPVPVPSLLCHRARDRAHACARALVIVPLCL